MHINLIKIFRFLTESISLLDYERRKDFTCSPPERKASHEIGVGEEVFPYVQERNKHVPRGNWTIARKKAVKISPYCAKMIKGIGNNIKIKLERINPTYLVPGLISCLRQYRRKEEHISKHLLKKGVKQKHNTF